METNDSHVCSRTARVGVGAERVVWTGGFVTRAPGVAAIGWEHAKLSTRNSAWRAPTWHLEQRLHTEHAQLHCWPHLAGRSQSPAASRH